MEKLWIFRNGLIENCIDEKRKRQAWSNDFDFASLASVSTLWLSFQESQTRSTKVIAKWRLPRFPSSVIESARLRSRPCTRNEKKTKRQTFFCLTSFSLASFLVVFIDIDQVLFQSTFQKTCLTGVLIETFLEMNLLNLKFAIKFCESCWSSLIQIL